MSMTLLTKTSAAADLAERRAYASSAGRRRGEALAILKKIGGDAAFVVSYGRASVTMTGDGEVFKTDKKKTNAKDGSHEAIEETGVEAATLRFNIHPSLRDVVQGASPLNKVIKQNGHTVPIPCGVCVLVGATGSGKTPLAHLLAQSGVEQYAVVRAGEPFTGYDTAQGAIAESIGRGVFAASDVVVDSIKDLLAMSGNTMKGGVSRSALVDLSAWSILGATLGTTFYVPLNPSSSDEESMKLMASIAQSNTSMTFLHAAGEDWSFQARTGEGLPRLQGGFKFAASAERAASPSSDADVVRKHSSDTDAASVFAGVTARARTFAHNS